MSTTGRRRLIRRMLAGVLLAAAMAGGVLAAGANVTSPHHALADDGVVNSKN